MNTEKMSHLVSMTANVGVLIGLSLLVYELNQNNQHLREQAEFVAFQTRERSIQVRAESSEIGRLIYGHLIDEQLNAADQARRGDYIEAMFVNWQWNYERERSGLVNQFDSFAHMASVFSGALEQLEAEDVWLIKKNLFGAGFRDFMDTQVIGPG